MDREQRQGLQYIAELGGVIALYAAVLYARPPLLALNASDGWQAIVKLLPALPIWAILWVLVRHYRRIDEYLRLQLLQVVAICAGIASCATSSYPFLRDAFHLQPVSIAQAWPVMAICWIIATLIVQFRNRRRPA